eukprot:6214273-Pleurochrysis_carterae.AAC.2
MHQGVMACQKTLQRTIRTYGAASDCTVCGLAAAVEPSRHSHLQPVVGRARRPCCKRALLGLLCAAALPARSTIRALLLLGF